MECNFFSVDSSLATKHENKIARVIQKQIRAEGHRGKMPAKANNHVYDGLTEIERRVIRYAIDKFDMRTIANRVGISQQRAKDIIDQHFAASAA